MSQCRWCSAEIEWIAIGPKWLPFQGGELHRCAQYHAQALKLSQPYSKDNPHPKSGAPGKVVTGLHYRPVYSASPPWVETGWTYSETTGWRWTRK
jgi:hypothetical protein